MLSSKRECEINNSYVMNYGGEFIDQSHYDGFIDGVRWADDNKFHKWIKFTKQFPPSDGTSILIAMKNKNKEDGIWLYDICNYYGGDISDNDNWEGKVNWELPVYWCYINDPE